MDTVTEIQVERLQGQLEKLTRHVRAASSTVNHFGAALRYAGLAALGSKARAAAEAEAIERLRQMVKRAVGATSAPSRAELMSSTAIGRVLSWS
jgi:hypothetical protein